MDKLKFKLKNLKNKLFSSKNIRIKLSIFISIVGLLCLIIGSSYAILENNIESENKQVINVGKVKLELIESKGGMNIESLIDMTDEEGFNQENFYSFHIFNVGDTPAEYDLLLVSESDSTTENVLDEDYIKVGLEINGEKTEILNLGEVNNIIHSTVINKSEDISYTLRVWLDPDTIGDNSLVDYTVSLKLKVNATQYMGDVGEQNTFYNIMKSEVQATSNGVLLHAELDDNEGSLPIYYYTGNVDNNNVIFGGFCWKIVRTTSTGGTKLIYNGVPSEDGTCNNTGTATQLSSTSKFNENYNSPADVGYMYGERYEEGSKDPSNDTYMYGNDVTFSDGMYTLTTTITKDWSYFETIGNKYHYTCFNTTGICSTVYYIYYTNSDTAYYLTFTNGDNLEIAKEKMTTNTNDSVIKGIVDNWYKENLIDYTNYLENTIFCNGRTLYDGGLESKDSIGGNHCYTKFRSGTSLNCVSQNDQFSLKVENGGTEGYGNNKLIYPVGLLTSSEASLAIGSTTDSYLHTGNDYWLLSPVEWYGTWAKNNMVLSTGRINSEYTKNSYGVRPVVSLKPGTQVLSGSGTVNDPYVVTK